MSKKKFSMTRIIKHAVMIIPTLFGLVFKIAGLLSYEARLAGKSLVAIVILGFMLGLLLTTTWVCILGVLIVYLLSLHWTLLSALGIVIAINIFLVLLTMLSMRHHKENLCFPEIRRIIHNAWTQED